MSPIRITSAVGCCCAGAAQHRAHARQQLGDRKRLGDVVVGAQLEAEHLVGLGRARRQHHDRRRDRPRAQLAAHVEAVLLRQHHVEDHQVRREAAPPSAGPRRRRPRSRLRSLRARGCRAGRAASAARLRSPGSVSSSMCSRRSVGSNAFSLGNGEVQRERAALLGLARRRARSRRGRAWCDRRWPGRGRCPAARRRARAARGRTCGRCGPARAARCRCRGRSR